MRPHPSFVGKKCRGDIEDSLNAIQRLINASYVSEITNDYFCRADALYEVSLIRLVDHAAHVRPALCECRNDKAGVIAGSTNCENSRGHLVTFIVGLIAPANSNVCGIPLRSGPRLRATVAAELG